MNTWTHEGTTISVTEGGCFRAVYMETLYEADTLDAVREKITKAADRARQAEKVQPTPVIIVSGDEVFVATFRRFHATRSVMLIERDGKKDEIASLYSAYVVDPSHSDAPMLLDLAQRYAVAAREVQKLADNIRAMRGGCSVWVQDFVNTGDAAGMLAAMRAKVVEGSA